MTPLPKRGFGPPLVRYVFHPPQVSVLCSSCTKSHDRADQKLFWRGPTIFGRARSLVRFPPPIRFAPPRITAQIAVRRGFVNTHGGKLFHIQLEFLCLQLSFFAYSPLRPVLDALSHCKQKTPLVGKKAEAVSTKSSKCK